MTETEIRISGTEAGIDDIDSFLTELRRIGDEYGVVIQVFDPCYIASRRHLDEAVKKASRAFDRDENVADSFGIEIMLYAAGTRQIDVATQIGVGEGNGDAVFLIVPALSSSQSDLDGAMNAIFGIDGVESCSVEFGDEHVLRDFYGIGDAEIRAVGEDKLEKLVLERVALLDVNK